MSERSIQQTPSPDLIPVGSETPVIRSFVGEDAAEVLREVADWLDDPEARRVLIGLWSTGFGEAWEVDLQVVVTEMRSVSDAG